MVNPLNLSRSDGPTRLKRNRLGLGALLVVTATLLGLLPLTTVDAATAPIRYGWNGGLQGWVGENSQASVDTTTKYEGAGALAGTRSVTRSWNTLRLNSPVFSPIDLRTSGTELSTYVYVPVGTPGRWSARLNVQSPSWVWAFGPAVPVTSGQWTRVTFTVPGSAAASVHRVGVQFEVTGASGTVRALVDSFRQGGTGSGTTTTTKAPTSTTSTTQAPTTTTAVTSTTTTAPPTTTPPATPPPSTGSWPVGADALQRRVLAELKVFTDWLDRTGAKGYIGEVGWPNNESTDRWNALADTWYQAADSKGLMVTAWATGEWWGSYNLAIYGNNGASIGTALSPARVVEAHRGGAGKDRGVNVNGGEFGIGGNLGTGSGAAFSNMNRGTYDRDYHYDSQATFNYLASRGVEVVRLPFRWERIQPTLGGPLDTTELTRLRDVINRANAAGIDVIPTVMNYGAYWMGTPGIRMPIGSSAVTNQHFADLWRRLAVALGDRPNISGWGLMNEPTNMPTGSTGWEQASQAAVDAIRVAGDRHTIFVPGYNWSTARRFVESHPNGPWIRDSLGNIRYEAHHYFDGDNSGSYGRSYDAELSDARSKGY